MIKIRNYFKKCIKGTWNKKLSMFLCVVLLWQNMSLDVDATTNMETTSVKDTYEDMFFTDSVNENVKHNNIINNENEYGYVGEIRYDFCDIDYSFLENEITETQELPITYFSLKNGEVSATASTSGNNVAPDNDIVSDNNEVSDNDVSSDDNNGVNNDAVSINSVLYDPVAGAPELLSPIRNQGNTNTCWAFAMMGAMELSAIRKDIMGNTASFSPYHFAYFQYHHVPDSLGGTQNDENHSQSSFLDDGGNLFMALFNAANWIGAADESIAPFDVSVTTGYEPDDSLCYANESVLLNGYMLSTDHSEGRMIRDIKKAVLEYGGVAIMYNGSGTYVNQTTGASYCPTAGTNHAVVIVGWDDHYAVDNFKQAYRPGQPGAWIIKNSYGEAKARDGYYYLSYEDRSIAYPIATEVTNVETYDNNYHYDGALSATDSSVVTVKSGGAVSNVFTAKASPEATDEQLEAVQIALKSVDVQYRVSIYKDLLQDANGVINPSSGVLLHTQEGTTTRAGIYTIPLEKKVILGAGDSFSVVFELSKEDTGDISVWAERDYNYGWCYGTADIQRSQSFRQYKALAPWSDLSVKDTESNIEDEELKGNEDLWNKYSCLARIKAFTNTLETVSSLNIEDFSYTISENSYVADGTGKCPEVTVKKGKEILVKDRDFAVTYQDNITAGTGKVVLTGITPYYGTVTLPFHIYNYHVWECRGHEYDEKDSCVYCGHTGIEQDFYVDESITKKYGEESFKLDVNGNEGTLSFESNNTDVVSVDEKGIVTINGVGNADILVTAAATDEYKKAQKRINIKILPLAITSVTLDETLFYYDGESKFPKETVLAENGDVLVAYRDYSIRYTHNTDVGTAFVKIEGIGNYEGSLLTDFAIIKRSQNDCSHVYHNGICKYCSYVKSLQVLSGTESYIKRFSDEGFYLDMVTNGDGSLTYYSDDTDIVKVDSKGYVTMQGVGSAYITVTASDTNNHYRTSRQVLVEVEPGKTILTSASVIQKNNKAKAFNLNIKTNSNGKLTYKSSDKKVATVSSKGKVTVKGYGKTTITVTSPQTELYNKKTKKITLTVVPKKASVTKVKAIGGKKVTIKIKKNSSVTGYKIQYSTDKNFKKGVKSKTLSSPKKTSLTITGLKKNKTYYFRVCSYKKVGTKKYYGVYSKIKKVKVK